jgi:hypothetical protein
VLALDNDAESGSGDDQVHGRVVGGGTAPHAVAQAAEEMGDRTFQESGHRRRATMAALTMVGLLGHRPGEVPRDKLGRLW